MSAADALAALVLVPVAVWLLGACIVPASGPAERIAAGVLAALGLAWLTMLQAPLGVGLLGHRVALDVAFAVGLAGLLAWRRPDLRPARIHLGAVAALVVPAAVVLAPGVVHPPNLIRSSDSLWHEGWTHQLVGGASDPGGPYAGIPNAYPWLFHALAAWSAQLLPGGVLTGFLAVQVLALLAAGAGMWLVCRTLGLEEDAAAWAVLLGVGAGGVGWLWQRSPAAVTFLKDGLGAYHGDFVLPNAMSTGMGNLPPILPREVALALVPLVVWAAVRSASGRSLGWALVAGYALGLAFLLGPDAGGVALAVVLALALAWRTLRPLAALASAAVVVAVWGLPLALHYHELGGFRSITTHEPIDPTAGQAAVALGFLPLLAVPGTVILARRPDADRRSLAAWAAVVVAVNAIAIADRVGPRAAGHARAPALAAVPAVPRARARRTGGGGRRGADARRAGPACARRCCGVRRPRRRRARLDGARGGRDLAPALRSGPGLRGCARSGAARRRRRRRPSDLGEDRRRLLAFHRHRRPVALPGERQGPGALPPLPGRCGPPASAPSRAGCDAARRGAAGGRDVGGLEPAPRRSRARPRPGIGLQWRRAVPLTLYRVDGGG